MGINDKINKARDLVDEGKYAQARKLLRGIKDPRAQRLMEEIDELAPVKTSSAGRDALHVILLGLVFTVLFGGIGYVIASSMGIPTAAVTPASTTAPLPTGETQGSQSVAVQPTNTQPPPPTDIPCEAQAWWDAHSAATAEVMNNLLNLSIQTPGQQIQANKQAFDAWRSGIEGETVAPCLSAVKSAVASAATGMEAVYNSYLTTSTEQSRAQAFVQMMDGLLPLTDELSNLNVAGGNDGWITTVQDFSRAECPANRWYNEIILGRDYKRFFTLLDSIDYSQIGAATNSLREMQSLRGSLQVDSETFPECVKPASESLLKAMDAFILHGNAQINGDSPTAGIQLQTATTELANFYSELGTLDSALAGIRLRQ